MHDADPDAQVLIGALASRGERAAAARTPTTGRSRSCARSAASTRKFKKLTTGRCRGFQPATADGFAFHPHGVLTAPETPFTQPGRRRARVALRLTSTLDRLQRGGRMKATTRRFNLFLDEFGYQTNPPDKLAGISLTQQDQWLQRAAYQAWRNPRVKLFSQYLWRDEPRSLNSTYGGWQSGLRFTDGRAKPALKHFITPFVLDTTRGRLWGQVRRRDTDTRHARAAAAPAARAWRTVATRATDSSGYWSWQTRLITGASYRYQAAEATSATLKRR